MVTLTKTIAAIGLVVTAFSTSAFADVYHHIDEVALRIDRQAKQLVAESRHYRHTPEYRHLVADARQMCQLAEHVHEVAHHRGSLAHLEADVAKLDATFHHLESVFDRVERGAAYGHGHIHGNTRHVKRLLNSIEDGIHHLQDDLRSLRSSCPTVRPNVVARPPLCATPPVPNWGAYNARPYSSGFGQYGGHRGYDVHRQHSYGRGITIGGGSSRFTFRF